MDIGLAGAAAGGVLTILSPCSVMLLPAFFAYAFADPRRLLARTGVFYLGLLTTLVPLGVLAGTLGSLVAVHREALISIGAWVVILLGLVQLAGVPLPSLRAAALDVGPRSAERGSVGAGNAGSTSTSSLAVYVLGTVYGLLGACTGPILGSVLTLSAMSGSPFYGGIMLAVFAAGMTAPLLLLSWAWSRLDRVHVWLRPRELRIGRWRNSWVQVISGAAAAAVGVLLLATRGDLGGGLLSASSQLEIETWALRASSQVADWWWLAGAALLIGLALSARRQLQRANRQANG